MAAPRAPGRDVTGRRCTSTPWANSPSWSTRVRGYSGSNAPRKATLTGRRPSPAVRTSRFAPGQDFLLPAARVLHEHGERGQAAEHDAVAPFAESPLEDVHAPKAERRAEEKPRGRGAHAALAQVLRRPARVPVEFLEVLVEVAIRVVNERLAQGADP